MKPLLFILCVFPYLFAAGQKQREKQPSYLKEGDFNCVYQPKYTVYQRNHFYPFNIAGTIKLVSFHYYNANYPFTRNTLITDSLIEMVPLSVVQVNKLTDILYNNVFKKKPDYGVMAQCYTPHNAILFFNKAGALQEFVSICFHCRNYRESSKKIKLGDDCDQKMDKLRLFFISSGVKFGTDPNIEYGGGKEEHVVPPPKD